MATFNNGESGSSVRAKINAVLQHADGTAGELVINEAGADVDFRVESDTNVNALFVDGAFGNVGIGTSSPVANGGFGGLTLNGTTGSVFSLMANGTETSRLGAVTGETFLQSMGSGVLKFIRGAGGTESMRIDASGNLGLGVVPSAWTSGFTALEMSGVGAGLYSTSSADMNLISNAYHSSGWKYGATAPAAWFQATSGAFKWNIAPSGTAGAAITFTQAMTLDASGNLGLGAVPSAWNTSARGIDISPVNGFGYISGLYTGIFANSFLNSSSQYIYKTTSQASYYSQVLGQHSWHTAPSGTAGNAITFTQAMTLDASGNLLVGRTTVPVQNTAGAGITPNGLIITESAQTQGGLWVNRITSDGNAIYFTRQNAEVGSISVTSSATSYNTSSDYRLKEDLRPIEDALSRLAALNPVNFAWKADGTRTDGFIAHEVQAVIPQAVTGEKDGEAMQAIDHSKLVPLLTAALQEALAEIASLKARLDAANL